MAARLTATEFAQAVADIVRHHPRSIVGLTDEMQAVYEVLTARQIRSIERQVGAYFSVLGIRILVRQMDWSAASSDEEFSDEDVCVSQPP
jgi:hypothetical protein